MRIVRLIASVVLLAFLVSPGIEASGLRIALLTSTEVQSDTILLANLLPANASQRIKAAAEKIALGSTPQNGASRQFSHNMLHAAIELAGLATSDFEVPGSVTVRRGSRLLTRDEVFAAIEAAITRNPVSGIPRLQPADLSLDAEVRVPLGDAGLEILQIAFDSFIGRVRVRMRARSAPAVLPFYVTAQVPDALSRPMSGIHTVSIATHSPITNPLSTPVLVAADRPARLHIHSSNMDMILEVRPLQSGRFGEQIRVRLPGTGRTLRARVIGDGYLDASL